MLEEQEEQFNYSFPELPQPEEGAKLLDLRHVAFTLTLTEISTGQVYSTSEIITLEKPKGKANKKAKILFALPIL